MLRAIGACGGVAAILPFVGACRRGRGPATVVEIKGALDSAELHNLLRTIVGNLSRTFDRVEGWIEHGTRTHIVRDGDGQDTRSLAQRRAVLVGELAGAIFVQTTNDLSVDGLSAAVSLLRPHGGKPHRGRRERELARVARSVLEDPRKLSPDRLGELVHDLTARAENVRDSRIVYRGAGLYLDDRDVIYVGPNVEYINRRIWCQGSVVLGAKTSNGFAFEGEHAAGAGGLELTMVTDDAVVRAAANALTMLTPRAAPEGELRLMAEPDVGAAIVGQCLAPLFEGAAWLSPGAINMRARVGTRPADETPLTIDASPLANGSHFDDEGSAVVPVRLIDAGVVMAPYADLRSARALGISPTGNGWRTGASSLARSRIVDVALMAATANREALLARVDNGLVLEGAASAQLDRERGIYRVRVRRARGVKKGVLSGFVYGDIELHGSAAALLASIDAVGEQVVVHERIDEGSQLPQRVASPAFVLRGTVGGWR